MSAKTVYAKVGERDVFEALAEGVALRVPHAITEEERAAFVAGVYRGKADWTPNFEGVQFTLGRAWYTHLEQDLTERYFAETARSDAIVEQHCPGLQARMLRLTSEMLRGKAVLREGYCGPGVHVFPAQGWCADNGGDIHFDTEGLTRSQLKTGTRAITLVLMLQPANKGGGLNVWDVKFEGSDEVTKEMIARPRADVDYAAAELVVISSYSLHQIQAFESDVDRVSATCHALDAGDGTWQVWF